MFNEEGKKIFKLDMLEQSLILIAKRAIITDNGNKFLIKLDKDKQCYIYRNIDSNSEEMQECILMARN